MAHVKKTHAKPNKQGLSPRVFLVYILHPLLLCVWSPDSRHPGINLLKSCMQQQQHLTGGTTLSSLDRISA